MVKRTFNRAERVGGQVQRVLASLIQKGVNDPRLAQATITGVTLSRDLRIAKIYVSTPGGAQEKETVLSGFESAKGFIKRALAKELGLRYMPDLKFFYDGSFDYGAQINRVLKSIQTDDEKDNSTADEQ
ncbi:30S ribosome-binding factor RbfA [Desulfosarcina ovata]|uniref:30S ribosome-binding factor RbfA n=1 Tax=Desulfosarcina ovata TaxID=83564 RepID=UPI0012D2D214|nr:30S ribosome-binding factor RbfA [Desulfosarcina ovata]